MHDVVLSDPYLRGENTRGAGFDKQLQLDWCSRQEQL